MCGIAGFIGHNKWFETDLKKMTDLLAHRGPDAEGYFFNADDNIGLGHRRLSIIDLSAGANQPFYSSDGRYVMVYNGEVYNYLELRQSKFDNHSWKTSSDTEVILECFASFGVSCFEWFNGMFAIAIWDRHTKQLYVCRDRIGIKPFYYYVKENNFAFASELKGLQILIQQGEIDYAAVTNFLYLGYIPQEQSIYKNCHKLLPGYYAVVSNKGIEKIEAYWRLEDKIESKTINDEMSAKKKLKELMEDSVKKCMISDVPLGIFLSGGIDSSLIAAIAQKYKKEKLNTFSIAFKEAAFDESVYSQKVADHIGSAHHKLTIDEADGIEIIHNFLNIYDEPYGDTSGIPTYMVSKLARQHVTVALCGDGGDELFMGYGFYTWAKRMNNPLLKPFHAIIRKMLYEMDRNNYRNKSYLFDYEKDKLKSNIFSQGQGNWALAEIRELLNGFFEYDFSEELLARNRTLKIEEEQSFFDIKNYLPEELLTKVDRASMQHGLEVRVPFLDSNIIDFALNLSPDLKYKKGIQKYLLKEVLYDYAPASFFARPKWGFAVPLQKWLNGQLSYLIDDYLNEDSIEAGGVLNKKAVTAYVKKFRDGELFRYYRVWLLIVLQKWLLEKHSPMARLNSRN